jgi:hypothetical protein
VEAMCRVICLEYHEKSASERSASGSSSGQELQTVLQCAVEQWNSVQKPRYADQHDVFCFTTPRDGREAGVTPSADSVWNSECGAIRWAHSRRTSLAELVHCSGAGIT